MRVKIQEQQKTLTDLSTDKTLITIGRGSECDIRILNQNISRSHLQIKKENGKVYISNISSNNWFGLNEDKLTTDEWVELLDTHTLLLPGELQVFITLDKSKNDIADNEPTNSYNYESDLTGELELDTKRKKTKRKTKVKTQIKDVSESPQNNKSQLLLCIIVFIGLVLYINRDLIK
ncbi:MAG: FHA domain-containing protein [Bacteriovoracaceae bacterium]|nr:FHA domain-containing protein [Bacteriovoracaceae bacterium]